MTFSLANLLKQPTLSLRFMIILLNLDAIDSSESTEQAAQWIQSHGSRIRHQRNGEKIGDGFIFRRHIQPFSKPGIPRLPPRWLASSPARRCGGVVVVVPAGGSRPRGRIQAGL